MDLLRKLFKKKQPAIIPQQQATTMLEPENVENLLRELQSDVPYRREITVQKLGKLNKTDERIVNALEGMASDSNQAVRDASRISKDDFDHWFQQIWNIPGASTKHHPAPFPLELATRLVRMFSFVGDTVIDPFCGSGTTMVAAFQTGRNSIGVEIDPDYCRMAARYLKTETLNLFSSAKLIFEKVSTERTRMVKEDQVLYEVRPARRKVK